MSIFAKRRSVLLKDQINPRLIQVHIDIRKAKLEELDKDLSKIFDGMLVESIMDADLNDLMRVQHLRYLRQKVRRHTQ